MSRPPTSEAIARIHRALATGDVAGAAAIAEACVAQGREDALTLNLAAWRREEAQDFSGAHALLRRALTLAPGDMAVAGSIGAVLRKEGRLVEALAVLDEVVRASPRHAAAWLERGYVLDALRDEAQAGDSYTRALAIDPRLAPALGKLADAAAKRGDAEEGRGLAARALAIDGREPAAVFAMAVIALEAREAAEAEARLRTLLDGALPADDRTRALTLLGDALDRQNRTEEAFAAWTEAQANFADAYRTRLAPTPERPSHRRFIETISARVGATPALARLPSHAPAAGKARGHVFLLGYPRSGTTLVENVLASAPEVVALEERDTMADADAALLPNDGVMPPLDELEPERVARLRDGYWRRVAAMAGPVEGRVFVDMNPFNGLKLPIIARLFPDARIVVMRRDPRDVVLSCYRINFTPSPAALAFSDLEETARHYDALMTLTAHCMERLPLAYHELRYERLVADFVPTVRALADFARIGWTDDFEAFDKTAARRGVRTASATQVRQGLYDGGGQWRRYAGQLAPVLPILAPWVERLGFAR